jgi:hypothetical protein
MATATEIATRALRRLQVIDPLEQPPALDVQHAEKALNAMLSAWEADGLSGDKIPFDTRFEQAIIDILAVRLADDYGKAPSAILLRDAQRGERQIDAAFLAVPEATFDAALVQRVGAENYSYAALESVPNYAPWQANTAYTLRMFVIKDANLYEVVTAGTSGSTGPTGTAGEITDGTVTWCWRRVLAA